MRRFIPSRSRRRAKPKFRGQGTWPPTIGRQRAGFVLVWFSLLLSVLLGITGLVIDGGLLFAAHRHTQNAADAAALAIAMDKLLGKTDGDAVTTANTFVKQYNGLDNAETLVLNQNVFMPPQSGPYAGKDLYVEVAVSYPVRTLFIHFIGINPTQQVTARAVATWGELRTAGEGAVVLDPRVQKAAPGFNVSGGGTVRVDGGIFDNNEGGGVDENGNQVNSNNLVAASGGQPNSATGIYTTSFRVVGGVDHPEQFKNYATGTNVPNILHAGILPIPDPLASLETPWVGNGVIDSDWGHVSVSNNNQTVPDPSWITTDSGTGATIVTLQPGIYKSLSITGGNVVFIPGIYAISAGSNNALKVSGGNVTAEGIMFYNTGGNYDPQSGLPDRDDPFDPTGQSPPPGKADTQFGDVTLNAGMKFSPIDTSQFNYPNSNIVAFDGMLFFQRRMNDLGVEIQGNSASGVLAGTIYAKWARFKISGQGTYDAQFVVGSMDITGTGNVTFHFAGQGRGKAPAVFLVE